MRGQITPITAVLLTGVVVAMVGAAYMWGTPLIEKRSIITQYDSLEKFVLQVDDVVTSIANNRAGSRILDIPTGMVRMVPDGLDSPDNNSIIFEDIVGQKMLFDDSFVPIHTSNLAGSGRYGTDRPRIITLSGEDMGGRYMLTFRVQYRNLTAAGKTFRISLQGDEPETGPQSITVSYGGTDGDTTLIDVDLS